MLMGMMGMNLTPHGLPPITPSMPPFSFLPQPGVPPAASGGGDDGAAASQKTSPTAASAGAGEAHPQISGHYLAHHLHHAHGAMLSPYAPFSPGVAMSPGAFWGRPGSAANPYINPAVGAPVHSYFPPVPSQTPRGAGGEEEYFPPFIPAAASTSRPSSLAHEIQPDQASTAGTSTEDGLTVPIVPGMSSEISPDSVGTTAGTHTTGTELSPRPPTPSSRGTSWQSDSGKPSPLAEVAKEMATLAIDSKDLAPPPLPRSRSTGASDDPASSLHAAPFVRAGSDPTQGGTSVAASSVVLARPMLGSGIDRVEAAPPDS